jgi:hypothetical protein
MQSIVTTHLVVGLLAVVAALTLVWRLPGRRITIYVLTLQILLGVYLLYVGYRVPLVHILCAVVAWALYMAANGIARRRPESRQLVLGLTIGATVLVVAACAIGGAMIRHASAT